MTLVLVSLEGCTSLWEVSTRPYFTSMLCNIGCGAISNRASCVFLPQPGHTTQYWLLLSSSSASVQSLSSVPCIAVIPSMYHKQTLSFPPPLFCRGRFKEAFEGILPILTMFSILGPKQYGGTKLLKVQIQNFLICVQVSKRWRSRNFSFNVLICKQDKHV